MLIGRVLYPRNHIQPIPGRVAGRVFPGKPNQRLPCWATVILVRSIKVWMVSTSWLNPLIWQIHRMTQSAMRTHPFTGSLDGNGHAIHGLNISRDSDATRGFIWLYQQ